MASMMITVDELRFKKAVYSKAAKNLREVIAVVKKAKNSIGNDRMFAEARQSLAKLAELLDRRATVLEALAEALVYSADTYKGAQTHSVSQISDYRAHKTDFYGKPVHVSGASSSGAAAAAAGGSAAAAASSSGSTTTSYSGSSGSTSASSAPAASAQTASTSATSASSGTVAENTVSSTSTESGMAGVGSYTENTTVNITNNTVVYNNTENIIVEGADAGFAGAGAGIAAETVSMAGRPSGSGIGTEPITVNVVESGTSAAGMFAAGAATAAGIGSVALGANKLLKNKKETSGTKSGLKGETSPIDGQLEEAKRKLQEIADKQEELRASIAADDNAGDEEN